MQRLQNGNETKKWYPATAKMFLATRHRGAINVLLLTQAFALRSSMITWCIEKAWEIWSQSITLITVQLNIYWRNIIFLEELKDVNSNTEELLELIICLMIKGCNPRTAWCMWVDNMNNRKKFNSLIFRNRTSHRLIRITNLR